MTKPITAPWSEATVVALNEYQRVGVWHPYTCPLCSDELLREESLLVATERGWICSRCEYTQNWAHPFSADPAWLDDMVASMTRMRSGATG